MAETADGEVSEDLSDAVETSEVKGDNQLVQNPIVQNPIVQNLPKILLLLILIGLASYLFMVSNT